LHLATDQEPQTSLCRALASLAAPDAYTRIDWPGLSPSLRREQVLNAARVLRPTLIFMQLQGPGVLAPATIAELRRSAPPGELTLVSWCGDVGGVNGPHPSSGDAWAFDSAPFCDLMLYSSLSQVRAHRSRGMHRAAYLQIGFDEDRYYVGPDDRGACRYDAVLLGNNYDDRNWLTLPGHDAELRRAVVQEMRSQLGDRFGLFGSGWGSGATHLAPASSGDIYRGARFAISLSLCSHLERYTSDRLLRALACGTPVLMKTFSDHASFGLVSGQNVLTWDRPGEAVSLLRAWSVPERQDAVRELGWSGASLARSHHSWGARMLELVPLIAAARGQTVEVTRPW
jgi:hypothetical protein